MSHVVADMSVSLDGFVADPGDGVHGVFAWYGKPQPAHSPRRAAGRLGERMRRGRAVSTWGHPRPAARARRSCAP
jgi:hypothetical protein